MKSRLIEKGRCRLLSSVLSSDIDKKISLNVMRIGIIHVLNNISRLTF